MQLYAGTSKDFIVDATRNAIATKLEHAFLSTFRFKPSIQEVHSWASRSAKVLRFGVEKCPSSKLEGHFLEQAAGKDLNWIRNLIH